MAFPGSYQEQVTESSLKCRSCDGSRSAAHGAARPEPELSSAERSAGGRRLRPAAELGRGAGPRGGSGAPAAALRRVRCPRPHFPPVPRWPLPGRGRAGGGCARLLAAEHRAGAGGRGAPPPPLPLSCETLRKPKPAQQGSASHRRSHSKKLAGREGAGWGRPRRLGGSHSDLGGPACPAA